MLAHKPHVRSSLMIGAVILVLSACGQPTLGHPSEPGGKVPADLKRFYDQKLTFGSCEGYATTDADAKAFANDTFKCARLEVPLDYQNPRGRTAQIALLRVPAQGKPSKRIGSLLLNPGGPGASGMSYAATVAKASADSPITKQFDLIGFDPRGVASSTPALVVNQENYDRFKSGYKRWNLTLASEAAKRQSILAFCWLRSFSQALIS